MSDKSRGKNEVTEWLISALKTVNKLVITAHNTLLSPQTETDTRSTSPQTLMEEHQELARENASDAIKQFLAYPFKTDDVYQVSPTPRAMHELVLKDGTHQGRSRRHPERSRPCREDRGREGSHPPQLEGILLQQVRPEY